jgi:hypothetical protein
MVLSQDLHVFSTETRNIGEPFVSVISTFFTRRLLQSKTVAFSKGFAVLFFLQPGMIAKIRKNAATSFNLNIALILMTDNIFQNIVA